MQSVWNTMCYWLALLTWWLEIGGAGGRCYCSKQWSVHAASTETVACELVDRTPRSFAWNRHHNTEHNISYITLSKMSTLTHEPIHSIEWSINHSTKTRWRLRLPSTIMSLPTCDNYKAKKCILGHIWPQHDLSTPKFDAFILAPKSISGENLAKFCQQIRKISC